MNKFAISGLSLVLMTGLTACSDDSDNKTVEQVTSSPAVQAPAPIKQAEPEIVQPAPPPAEPEIVEQPVVEVTSAGEEHVVGTQVTAFVPMVIFIEPGDIVTWTNMAGHDTTSLEGMIPDGGETWQSKMGENYSVTLTVPGVYMYKCTPHASMGMIGAIVVGETPPANLDAILARPENKGMIGRAIRKLKKALEAR